MLSEKEHKERTSMVQVWWNWCVESASSGRYIIKRTEETEVDSVLQKSIALKSVGEI